MQQFFKVWIFKVAIIFTISSSAQNDFKTVQTLLNNEVNPSLKKKKLDSLICNSDNKNSTKLTFLISLHFYKNKQYPEAIFYGHKNLETIIQKQDVDSLSYRRSLCNLGLFHYYNKEIERSERFYQKVLSQQFVDKYQGRAFYRLGAAYEDMGDYYAALDYYRQAIKIFGIIGDHNKVFEASVRAAEVYKKIGGKINLEKGKQLLYDILDTKKQIFIKKNALQDLHHVLGILNNQVLLVDKIKAEEHYFKALELAKKKNYQRNEVGLYSDIGNLYLEYDLEKAFIYLSAGLERSNSNRSQAIFLHNLGVYYYRKGNADKAIELLQQSILRYLNMESTVNVLSIPIQEFESSAYKSYLIDAFVYLIAYQNECRTALADLHITHQYVDRAEQLLSFLRLESDDQQSKLYWQEQATRLYERAVTTAFLSQDFDKAFRYMEKNKAVLLLEDITDRELKKNAKLPQSIRKREKELKEAIYTVMDQYTTSEAIQKESLMTEIGAAKIRYHNFIDSLKVDYPQYYQYKRESKVTSVTEVQAALQDDEVVIEYLLLDEEGYGLWIDKQEVRFFELRQVRQLHRDITSFKSKMTAPFITQQDFEDYYRLGHAIYKKLFPFEHSISHLADKKITIVPDHNLQNFPFEALVIHSHVETDTDPYLISIAEVSYAYSMSFLKENQRLSRRQTSDFTGFAPIAFTYDQLPDLQRSNQEIEEAAHIFSGQSFVGEEATKSNFENHTANTKIIHLSTHANATDSIRPWIAFKYEKLTLNELYTTRNNAELVVLSACNSAQGKYSSGEGVMSLVRGFFYAGANSVVSSLWNVNEKSGYYITTNFFKYLKKGKSKSAALRLAKLDYLQEHSLSEVSPYYWSSLILIGDTSAIHTISYFWIGIGLLISVVILFFWLYWKKKIGFWSLIKRE